MMKSLSWEHKNINNVSFTPHVTGSTNNYNAEHSPVELVAVGADAGLMKPFVWHPVDKEGLATTLHPYPGFGNLSYPAGACTLDRIPIPCDQLQRLMDNGNVQVESLVRSERGSGERPKLKPKGTKSVAPALGWEVVRQEIRSYGGGLFGVDAPAWRDDNEGGGVHWEQVLFTFGASSTSYSQHASQNPRIAIEKVKAAVGECSSDMFNVDLVDFQPSTRNKNGSFIGSKQNSTSGNSGIYIVNEVRAFNSSQLTALNARFGGDPPPRGTRIIGLTIPSKVDNGVETGFSPYRNFTANNRDIAASHIIGVNPFTETQIWELGNSLDFIVFGNASVYPVEPGLLFMGCVKKKLQGGN